MRKYRVSKALKSIEAHIQQIMHSVQCKFSAHVGNSVHNCTLTSVQCHIISNKNAEHSKVHIIISYFSLVYIYRS